MTETRKIREALSAKSVELQRRLRCEAEHDYLTGLYNRGAAGHILPSRLAAARANVGRAAFALLDLVHFKRFNDNYGRPVSDEVLRCFATALRLDARAGECAFRYGGEEFLVFLLAASADDVLARCAAWRAYLGEIELPFSAGVDVMLEAGVEIDQ